SRKIRVADALDIGWIDMGQFRPGPDGQTALVEGPDDIGRHLGLELFRFRIRIAEVSEDISRAADHVSLVVLCRHRRASLSRLIRSRIKSISCFGVLMPWVDFF